ncbi:MAG: response regulator [Chloroflexi bacterium]|nr:response regulator [Chloroflexota bacterium]
MRAFLNALFQLPILRPPTFEETERTRVARYLYYVLLSTITGMVGFMLMPALLGDLDIWYLIICGGVGIICLTLLFLVRLGYVTLASMLFIGSVLLAIVVGGFVKTGIRTPGLMAVPLLLTICSLLLSRRATFIMGLLCLLSITGLLFRGHTGEADIPPHLLDISYFAAALIDIGMTVLILHLTVSHTVQNARQIQQQAQELSKLNAELQLEMRARARTEKLLYQEQKLESIGLLAGGVAHDFNNLFTSILAQSMLVRHELTPDHKAYHHLEKSIKATQRAAELTRQLLAYTGRSNVQSEPLDLNQLIEENRELLGTALQQHSALVLELQPLLPLIEAAHGQIQQVIMNLLINAAEAIQHESGQIRVTTGIITLERAPDPFDFVGQAPATGRYVRLTVQDNGSGMPQAVMDRIFDPYFTTKARGHGLGLSAVLGIIQAHQGGLQVTSTPGEGSCFQVYLPTSQQKALAIPVEKPTPLRSASDALILVIDDQEEVCEAAVEILHNAGYRTLSAANGHEGVARFQEHQTSIGLVLLDVLMPGINGLETLEQLRAIDPAVKVILTSGYSERTIFAQMQRHHPTDFLPKPYLDHLLLNRVATVLSQ